MPPLAGSTNAVDVKANLVTLIHGLPEADAEKWDIDWGFARTPERTWVYCGEIQWSDSTWVTNRSRQEIFTIKVVVNVKRRRATPEDVEREVTRIASLIEAAVKVNPNLGDAAVVTSGWVPQKMDSWPSDEFAEAQFEADVSVTARF